MVKYSVFAPIKNEQGNIIPLYNEIKKVMDSISSDWELLLVNDGSTDNSMKEILSIKDKRVRPIALLRNYGQAVAMEAGFKSARGDIVISIDADLQNDPSDIPKMLKKLDDENLDIVCGWRYKRKDPLWMLFITMVARFLRSLFASDGIHDSGCTLRVYRKWWVEDMELYGEMHRYIVALLRWKGARVGEMKVNHRPRTHGKTKYNWQKSFRGFIDLMYIWFWKKFSNRPQHLFGLAGIGFIFLGGLSFLQTVYLKFVNNVSLSDSVWFVMSFFLLIMGVQFFVSGIMLDIMIKNHFNTSSEKRYVIRDIVPERQRDLKAKKIENKIAHVSQIKEN
jgi:glycosyltransferase involved in cell wall biosynthesis